MSYGFASNLRDAMPNASFIGFTGTPIEQTDANTPTVFGDYISIYDIQRAVADNATVTIYYESRISKLSLNAAALRALDEEFEEITEGEELTRKEQLKSKWAALEAAGLQKPDISILSDQFLAEVRGLPHKNVAAELLEKLLKDELKVRSRKNLVQSQMFSEKLKKTLNSYHNRAISTMEVIEELIRLAKDLDAASKRGETLGLTDDEVAFYDALATNASAVEAMTEPKLKVIAAELVSKVKANVTIDWNLRESARARIKVLVKRILKKYGYPPDLEDAAVKMVLAQAELLCADWV
jgi:type I site-specific restriction-modification system R (restriction) subunit